MLLLGELVGLPGLVDDSVRCRATALALDPRCPVVLLAAVASPIGCPRASEDLIFGVVGCHPRLPLCRVMTLEESRCLVHTEHRSRLCPLSSMSAMPRRFALGGRGCLPATHRPQPRGQPNLLSRAIAGTRTAGA
eukprot:4605409-Heterocapsa_arctica.AAC.1